MRLTVTLGCGFALWACSSDPAPVAPGGVAGGVGGATAAGGAAATGGLEAGGTQGLGAGGSSGGAGSSSFGGTSGSGAGGSSNAGGSSATGSGGSSATGPGGGAGAGGSAFDGGGSDGAAPESQRLAVTADFLNQTLSIVDLAKLKEGAKREDALVGTVDLGKFTPGPLDLAITPNGKTALVAISGGWLGAFTTVPPGNGTLLFVDIPTRSVVGELYTGASPMGIAITKDGKRAFVGQYAETYLAIVDIEHRTFEKLQTGARYNEEVAIDDTGSVGILTYGPAGNCTTFSVDDPAGQHGVTRGLTGDAGGAVFFPGTKFAYVVQAPTPLTGNVGGHNVVDAKNPSSPVASDNVRVASSPTWYPVTAVARRNSVAFPSTKSNELSVVEMKLEGSVAKEVQTVRVGAAESLAYGITATPDGRVLTASPREHSVAVVDLNTAKAFIVPWNVTKSGPTDVKIVP